jgi:hypothetical protein
LDPDYKIIFLQDYLPQVLVYEEAGRRLSFDVQETKDVSTIWFPPRLGDSAMTYEISEAEQPDVFGRIAKFFSGKKRYGFFGREKKVEFRKRPAV